MNTIIKIIVDFVRGPQLPREARHTYVRHLTCVILTAITMGILANVPVMAVKRMAPANWKLALRLVFSGGGQLFVLYLGGWMAKRPKMPFVIAPGLAFAVCSFALIALTGNAFLFLGVLGIGVFFETLSRPAIAAVIRLNYPVTDRGAATGELRKWSSLIFLLATLLSAWAFDFAKADPVSMARGQLLLAGVLSVIGFWAFKQIRVKENAAELDRRFTTRPKRRPAWGWSMGSSADASSREWSSGRTHRRSCPAFGPGEARTPPTCPSPRYRG